MKQRQELLTRIQSDCTILYSKKFFFLTHVRMQYTQHVDINTTMQMLQCKYERKHSAPTQGSGDKPVTTVCLH